MRPRQRCRKSRKRAMRCACRSRLPASSNSSSANPRAPAPSSSPCSAMPSCRAAARSGSARCWNFSRRIDIDSGVVRTAMSRLAADGWLERNKVGRNSFYRLVEEGAADLRCRDPAHLRSAAVGLDRALRTAADRQWRGSRRLARGAEKCRLRQSAAGRVGRAVGRAGPGGGRAARSGWKSPPRTTAAGGCSAKAGRSIAPRTPI